MRRTQVQTRIDDGSSCSCRVVHFKYVGWHPTEAFINPPPIMGKDTTVFHETSECGQYRRSWKTPSSTRPLHQSLEPSAADINLRAVTQIRLKNGAAVAMRLNTYVNLPAGSFHETAWAAKSRLSLESLALTGNVQRFDCDGV
jgi:hypothetical protein